MLVGAKGNLTMVGLNTAAQKVFWNGVEVLGIQQIKVDVDGSERIVKLVVSGDDDSLYMELVQAGVQIKKLGAKRHG